MKKYVRFFLLFVTFVTSMQTFANSGFVYRDGTKFKLDGRDFYFQGTNFYRIGLKESFSEDEVYRHLQAIADQGLKLVRLWGFSCKGSTWGTPILNSASESWNDYNQNALRRLDLAIAAARQANLKVILPLVNFEPEYCGMKWWTQQVIGNNDRQTFYTDGRVKQAFKNHVAYMLNRQNTIYQERFGQALAYKNDPTIMAIELANEPHTEDWYEINRGMKPGDLVYQWLKEISAFVKSIDRNHLVSTGEEGYKVSHDWGPHAYRHAWIHNGSKGVDFARNITIKDIDFATAHIYPDNWRIPSADFWWVEQYLIKDRANIAHQAGKPIIMEEMGFGMQAEFSWAGYQDNRRYWIEQMHRASNEAGYAGTMVWQIVPPGSERDFYTFDFNASAASAIFQQAHFMNDRSGW